MHITQFAFVTVDAVQTPAQLVLSVPLDRANISTG